MSFSCKFGEDCNLLGVVVSSLENSIILHILDEEKELSQSELISKSSEYIEHFLIPREMFQSQLGAHLSQLDLLGLIEREDDQKYKITQHGEYLNSQLTASFNHVASLKM